MSVDIKEHYQKLLAEYGDSPQATQYSDRETQELRFDYLVQIDDLNGKLILDFGCGTAHLATYLKSKGVKFDYIGVDIVPEFLEIAKQKHPEFRFGSLEDFQDISVDYAFVCGVFNNKMADNQKFYQDTIKTLFEKSKQGISFNMMSSYVDYYDDNLFYEKPENVFAFAKNHITPFVVLRNDYQIKQGVPPFDFTVYLYRDGK